MSPHKAFSGDDMRALTSNLGGSPGLVVKEETLV